MNKNGDDNPFCYFHPKEKLIGVCAFCLREKLLVLAAKQGHLPQHKNDHQRKSSLTLTKIFALSFLIHRPNQNKSIDFDQDTSTSTSLEVSFISIRFEDNGAPSWDKDMKNPKISLEPNNKKTLANKVTLEPINKGTTKSVIEHVKPHASSLWWRKRIGQMFQLVRGKRSSKANVCHVGKKVGGVKVRKGWIRSLTKRKRTME
ncbi:hypothetical protein ACHQM5_022808 [Ranunculus cassubicifolius]